MLGAEYERLRESSRKGKKSVLDGYGAAKPAEFFAVATECFFEKPAQMRKKPLTQLMDTAGGNE